jgi:hypothetical protein
MGGASAVSTCARGRVAPTIAKRLLRGRHATKAPN